MDKTIYLEQRNVYTYPNEAWLYAPGSAYPEYPFSEVSDESNEVYDMVRQSFVGLGLDLNHFGEKEWNPLGEYITPGDTVVIKPNLVKDYDDPKQYVCTVTHPAVVRAIVDYCIIANAKKIIIGDAPIQSADFDKITRDCGYEQLVSYYRQKGINLELVDFRNFVSKLTDKGIILPVEQNEEDAEKSIVVHMGKYSKHYVEGESNSNRKYAIIGYDNERMNHLHQGERHDYLIAKQVLEADVIINVPKPKTHRYAGLTAAQKNFVGCCADKDSLPHFTQGAPCVGGDETNERTIITELLSFFYREYLKECKKLHFKRARLTYVLYRIFHKLKSGRLFSHGAWYGNDTIWKTIIDLNKILIFADKEGKLCWDKPQRKILTIGDMIIAGQKEGPLNPIGKQLGMILISKNCAAFDYVFCKIAGFDEKLIPTVHHSIRNTTLSANNWEEILLYSNADKVDKKKISELDFEQEQHFEPHPFWKDILKG